MPKAKRNDGIKRIELRNRRGGRPEIRYEVRWSTPVRDRYGRRVGQDDHKKRFKTYSEAAAHARAASAAATDATLDHRAAREPFERFAVAWLDTLVNIKPHTRLGYETFMYRWVLPEFGPREVGSIRPVDCDQFVAKLAKAGLSPASTKQVVALLRRTLAYAARLGAITSNPATGMEMPKGRAVSEPYSQHVLTREQVEDIAANLREPYGLMVFFMAYTGVRASELAGLNLADLDTRSRTVRVARIRYKDKADRLPRQGYADAALNQPSIDTTPGKAITVEATPKTKNAVRVIHLPAWLADRLAAYVRSHPFALDPSAPLWPGYAGRGSSTLDYRKAIEPRTFYRNDFRKALLAAGLPASGPARGNQPATKGVRLHDLRHFYASYRIGNGATVPEVASAMGHANGKVTMEVYAHLLNKDDRPADLDRDGYAPAPRETTGATVTALPVRR